MANSLNQELEGKVVVLRADALSPEYQDIKQRLFRVTGGLGAHGWTKDEALQGHFLTDGEPARADGYQVERLATPEEIALVQ